MEAEIEKLQQEIAYLTESLHTTRIEVDALGEEREESKRILEEARTGMTIEAL